MVFRSPSASSTHPHLNVLFTLAITLMASCGGGCSNTSSSPSPGNGNNPSAPLVAIYDPGGQAVPFPNDMYFSGGNGQTLNLPLPARSDARYSAIAAINELDGFSTMAPIDESFSAALDPSSLIAGQTIYVFEVSEDPISHVVKSIVKSLLPGIDYSAGLSNAINASGQVMQITPLKPLDPSSSFLVVLTKGIQGANGKVAESDRVFQEIETAIANNQMLTDPVLQPLEPQVAAMLNLAKQQGIESSQVIVSWSFTTQSIADVLAYLQSQAAARTITAGFTGFTTATLPLPTFFLGTGHADVYAGDVSLPYYLGVPSAANPMAPVTVLFETASGASPTHNDFKPIQTATLNFPLILTVPNAQSVYEQGGGSKPANGWPLVIFQHGYTFNREDIFGIADRLADAGLAVIAIDLPLHGITNPFDPFYQSVNEPTFNLDLKNNATGSPGADGQIDPSGSWFLNYAHPLTWRDNYRQAATDLFNLTQSVPVLDIDGDGKPDLDGSRIYYVGHSLGAMTGIMLLAFEKNIRSATLGMPEGDYYYAILTPPLTPIAGLTTGGVDYDGYVRDLQTVVDPGDPVNYAALAAANAPLHMIEVVGATSVSPPDQIVPNFCTDILASQMGLTEINQTTVNPNGLHGIVRFTSGVHGSLVFPLGPPAVTTEMQQEMVIFAAGLPSQNLPGNGRTIYIQNSSIIKGGH